MNDSILTEVDYSISTRKLQKASCYSSCDGYDEAFIVIMDMPLMLQKIQEATNPRNSRCMLMTTSFMSRKRKTVDFLQSKK